MPVNFAPLAGARRARPKGQKPQSPGRETGSGIKRARVKALSGSARDVSDADLVSGKGRGRVGGFTGGFQATSGNAAIDRANRRAALGRSSEAGHLVAGSRFGHLDRQRLSEGLKLSAHGRAVQKGIQNKLDRSARIKTRKAKSAARNVTARGGPRTVKRAIIKNPARAELRKSRVRVGGNSQTSSPTLGVS